MLQHVDVQVVDLIKSGGDSLTLTVISVSAVEADRLDPPEHSESEYIDYSEKRSLPITVPDYRHMEVRARVLAYYSSRY